MSRPVPSFASLKMPDYKYTVICDLFPEGILLRNNTRTGWLKKSQCSSSLNQANRKKAMIFNKNL
jgi:hypothetical protein